jgi:hypothetical protein
MAEMPNKPVEIPVHNSDWDQSKETIYEFADRMNAERGWLKMMYYVWTPEIDSYPSSRVDDDSIMWVDSIDIQFGTGEAHKCMIAYVAPAEAQLLLLAKWRDEGVITPEEYKTGEANVLDAITPDEAREAINRISAKKVLTEPRSAVTHFAGGPNGKGQREGEKSRV